MESKDLSADENGDFCKKKLLETKIDTNEIASDRESSIESFHTNKSELSNTTGTEFIDVDDIELSDEESWLYKSPKKISTEEKSLNTYKWLHKDVEDMDNEELRVTKKALVSKLNQLQILSSSTEVQDSPGALSNKICDKMQTTVSAQALCQSPGKAIASTQSADTAENHLYAENKVANTDKGIGGNFKESSVKMPINVSAVNELFDVTDVQKIARLQEESLKQSMPRYNVYAERRNSSASRSLSPAVYAQNTALSKPSSVEALNTFCGKSEQPSIYSLPPAQRMKKINSFGSSSALHYQNLEMLRGSLPNINKGYYSLRSKKSNRPSDQKMPCPLPICPSYLKAQVNGSMTEISNCKPAFSSCDQQGSRTLPSSYRMRSRNTSKRDLISLTPSPRRESSPFFPNHQNGSLFNTGRRESAPGSSRRFLSPASSPTIYQRSIGSTTSLQSPTKSSNNSPENVRSSSLEHHRTTSHSSSRRMPLTTVHNRSPQHSNSPASFQNGEFRATKMPSKIPSPASRSGIPVPSSVSKANNEDNWSHDCF